MNFPTLLIRSTICLVLLGAYTSTSADPDKYRGAMMDPLAATPGDELRTRLLNTLENAEGTAAGIGMSELLADRIEAARLSLMETSDLDLETMPPSLHDSLGYLELGSAQMRLYFDPELQQPGTDPGSKANAGLERADTGASMLSIAPGYDKERLAEPAYPSGSEADWSFSFTAERPGPDEEGPDNGEGEGGGICRAPGTGYGVRAVFLTTAITASAVHSITSQFCGQTIAGFNGNAICAITAVIEAIAVGIDAHQSLCNEHIGAAEVSATWAGIKTVHGNVQHTHDDLEKVDAALSSHAANIAKDVTELGSDLDATLDAHDQNMGEHVNTHDDDSASRLAAHDTRISGALSAHDTHISGALSTHDVDVKVLLANLQATADENQRLLKIGAARQLEALRLLVTPEGRREVDEAVLSCTGDDCPLVEQIFDR